MSPIKNAGFGLRKVSTVHGMIFFKSTFICIQYYIDLFEFGWSSMNVYDKYTSKECN